MKKLILLSTLVFLVGCATVGKPIDQNKISQIKEGVTTEQEVVDILGSPYMKTLSSDGKIIMLYQYAKVKNRTSNFIPVVNIFSSGMDIRQQMLTILINKDGKVERYTMNDSNSEINSGLVNTR
ncbi:MAG: outer membrane protein assembly factor BamE [Candidatus Omnitrophota bacterium]|jgi:outer membrane protein assembly factor BamE (lipoprotein component of BamABCDE complex)